MGFVSNPEQFEAFAWLHLRGKDLMELPIGDFHRELISLTVHKKVAIAAPRQFSKSTWAAKFYPLYRALEDPGAKIMIVSSTQDLGMGHLEAIKAIIDHSPSLKEFYGEQKNEKEWRKEDIVLKNGSKIYARGYTGRIRGDRTDLVVCDDIEDDEVVESPDRLKKLEDIFNNVILQTLDPDSGQAIVIGTILHPESFLAKIIESQKHTWETRFYQAIKQDGTSLWPGKWPISLLEEKRKELTEYSFQQEYMNNPIPPDLRKFQRQWFKYFESEPPGCNYYTAVDPAIETKDVNDETAIVTIAVDHHDNAYVVEVFNKRMLPSEIIDRIFETYKRFKSTIGIEIVGYQRMLEQEVKKQRMERGLYPVIVELKSGGRRKTVRIEAMQPRFEHGKIYFKKGMDTLESQLLRFPSPRTHDDCPDSLSYALSMAHPSSAPQTKVNPDSFDAALEEIEGYTQDRKIFGRHRVRSWH